MEEVRIYEILVSIDFGTSRTAISYQIDGGEIVPYSFVNKPASYQSFYKAPTLSLYDMKENRLIQICHGVKETTTGDTKLIPVSKLHLLDVDYCGLKPEKIIEDFFKMLLLDDTDEQNVIPRIKAQLADKKRDTKMEFFLTVPAIWNHTQNLIMRNALARALSTQFKDPPIHLVLEPEAALFAFVKDNMDTIKDGDTILVVDAGGGTNDFVLHKVIQKSPLKVYEMCEPRGGLCGSHTINLRLLEWIKSQIVLPEETNNQLADDNTRREEIWKSIDPEITNELTDDIENKKILLKTYRDIVFDISGMEELFPTEIVTRSKGKKRFNLTVNESVVKNIYEPSVMDIIHHLKEITSLFKVNHVYFVGGFSNSTILQKEIQLFIKDVVWPSYPEAKIAYGCACYAAALKTSPVIRYQRRTIGIGVSRPWNNIDSSTKNAKRKIVGGVEYCGNVFQPIILNNDDVTDRIFSTTFNLTNNTQKLVLVDFWVAKNEFYGYINPDSHELIGQLIITLPNNSLRNDQLTLEIQRNIDISVKAKIGTSLIETTLKAKPLNNILLVYHIILVIDSSGSMDASTNKITRLETVFEACKKFISLRKSDENLKNHINYVSLIKFNSVARTVFNGILLEELAIGDYLQFQPFGGTDFSEAIRKVKTVIREFDNQPRKTGHSSKAIPIVIFLSDGEDTIKEPIKKISKMYNLYPHFSFHTIFIGEESNSNKLQDMARAGGGEFIGVSDNLETLTSALDTAFLLV
eukprot:TRINITY_DN22589_c0_g1_i1.p1 TRINITY_DN22589_c0_g1~~TRINITY_DN22589_c0_g1_i1.p1  ORF type:complete len:749 (+),score=156.13 TRINITY_DN22589_c0_g1_i1:3-2249(+)